VLRLLGLLGGLSLTTDLGAGAPLDESLQRCLVATRLARLVGCEDAAVSDVLYSSLLEHLGCTAFSHEGARVFGDDISVVRMSFLADEDAPAGLWRIWVPGVARSAGRSRARVLAALAVAGRRIDAVAPVATCEVARDASRRLGLPASVQESLFHATARWDGTGYPPTAGQAIPLAARVMHVASTGVLFALHADERTAADHVRRRSGGHLDPELCDAFLDAAPALLGGLLDVDAYEQVLAAEPDPVRLVDDSALVAVAATFGDLVDLKSPSLHGHSTGVAELAAAATERLGLASDVATVRVAGLLHDLGRAGVSSRIWDKPGPLSQSERDQARMHAHHSERILARVPTLRRAATLAGQHHERCDGSGYHRGLTAAQLPVPSRVLAAADAFRTLVEGRPHHAALPADRAADLLRAEVRAGGLDGDAVAAVLHCSGTRAAGRASGPAGLTPQQVAVLRLLAAGRSNREIANQLVISSRTAEHHVQDVYRKIGVSTRAAAALFAMEHGLADEPG
jgi:putative nucleotidyltransferase with HDIG domain